MVMGRRRGKGREEEKRGRSRFNRGESRKRKSEGGEVEERKRRGLRRI